MSRGAVRVLVYLATDEPDALGAAYETVSAELAGTPGLLGNELLRSAHRDDGWAVASLWSSRAAFDTWEQGPTHRDATAPLRRFQDPHQRPPYGVYEVVGSW